MLGDILSSIAEIDEAIANLKSWMAPQSVGTPLLLKPASSKIVKDPKGVVLVSRVVCLFVCLRFGCHSAVSQYRRTFMCEE